MTYLWPIGSTARGAWGMLDALKASDVTSREGVNSYLRANGAFEGYWVN